MSSYDEYDIPPGPSQKTTQPPETKARAESHDSGAKRSKNKPSPQRKVYEEYTPVPAADRRIGKRHSTRAYGVVNLLLLATILLLLGVGVWRTLEYRTLAEMKTVVARQTFYPGTTVEGIDVSAMTLGQALDYWDQQIEPRYRDVCLTLDDGSSVAAGQLGYTSDYKNVLTRAWNANRRGSLQERYLRASTGSAQENNYNITRRACDEAVVRRFAAWIASQVDAPAQDAQLSGFNADTCEFEFVPEMTGYRLDQAALVRDVEEAINAGGGYVERVTETITPSVTLEDLSSRYGMITSATTDASSSSDNRLSNIRLAMSIINGTCLHPGEQFSFNETVGERSEQRGFSMATAYSSGTVTEEVGGGICQVSTTLFNAAVKADLKIDERHSHSLTVSYVDLGKDAAVDWSSKDLKFTNNSDGDIYILCRVDDDKRLYIGIFGLLLPAGEYITVEGVKTGEVDFETRYQLSFELFSGQTRELQKGKPGYTAEAYKIRWDAQGNELSRELLCRSSYSSTPEIIEYAP